ncbi:hypothetical protein P152DRAFT_386634 [Eremomyces bilateralis CBS 781.70]|uniref:Uncharacterized protein n=1 Tax=Eremomyces bilateralis CBS 781.70 TaxID=1392243 RepID=A0A6G1GHN1_9PEZI|nr:uncharacterized protein P152DRAFT_386634 [Eremomyces bilateralis CBS 781.70]KAF1817605.1 hypothetical protein P152DRAFT_386634 [Eremomyces bilateralis CBS 781.70]
MAVSITSPNPQILLQPILACLPTAFASPRPPPALLPLVSPILRQKLQYLSDPSGSWLQLLCWDKEQSSSLKGIVEELDLEPHPTSGEIELPDIQGPEFQRLDKETLHTRFQLPDLQLAFIYLWCDEGGDNGSGWRLAELLPISTSSSSQNDAWSPTISSAEDRHEMAVKQLTTASNGGTHGESHVDAPSRPSSTADDDSYWAMYDQTPGRTPNRTPAKRSPAPTAVQPPTAEELEYFARYMSEVQPALDPEDPDEQQLGQHESTLNGDSLPWHGNGAEAASSSKDAVPAPETVEGANGDTAFQPRIESPQPRSSRSSSSARSVEKLEEEAARSNQTEVAVKQHISTDIKSLFRLAKASGMDRAEFERVVKTELEMLVMMERE